MTAAATDPHTAEPLTLADIRPGVLYPVRVYQRLFSLSRWSAMRHIAKGIVIAVRTGDGNNYRIDGAEILRVAGRSVTTPATETARERQARADKAMRDALAS